MADGRNLKVVVDMEVSSTVGIIIMQLFQHHALWTEEINTITVANTIDNPRCMHYNSNLDVMEPF